MDALVDVAAVVVRVYLLRAGDHLGVGMDVRHGFVVAEILALGGLAMLQLFRRGRARLVHPDAGADYGLGQLQVRSQELDLVATVDEAVPVVGRASGGGVVEILQFVSPANDAQDLVGVASLERQHNCLFRGVIGLGLEHDVTRDCLRNGCDVDNDRQIADARCSLRSGRSKPGEPLVAMVRRGGPRLIRDGRQGEFVGARSWSLVRQVQVRVQGMQDLGPAVLIALH